MINCYHIPTGFIIPATVLEHDGKFYSFGATIRSFESIWEEVKDKLETLDVCDFSEEDLEELDISQYLARVLEE